MVIEIKSTEVNTDMEDLFSIDGVMYQIPSYPSGSVTLQFLEIARAEGELPAIGWVMREMLGKDGHKALLGCKALSGKQLQDITDIVVAKVNGVLEDSGK